MKWDYIYTQSFIFLLWCGKWSVLPMECTKEHECQSLQLPMENALLCTSVYMLDYCKYKCSDNTCHILFHMYGFKKKKNHVFWLHSYFLLLYLFFIELWNVSVQKIYSCTNRKWHYCFNFLSGWAEIYWKCVHVCVNCVYFFEALQSFIK